VGIEVLQPNALLLLIAVALDLLFGDPVYRLHPIRLMGATLSWFERLLRSLGADGYIGGCVLFLLLAALWVSGVSAASIGLDLLHPYAGQAIHVFVLFSMIALGDLFKHGRDVDSAVSRCNISKAREAVARLVGRDTNKMDGPACRRAAIESLSESLVDGFASPILWYAVLGLPGIVVFKVVSTMDSMVGYKTPRYLQFGWCGARLDDLMNLIPARLSWLLIAIAAAILPCCSAAKALQIGWQQHALIPGPNAGWSEAAIAGALQRRLIGPIWMNSALVTDLWIGEPTDPDGGSAADYRRALQIVAFAAVLFTLLALHPIVLLSHHDLFAMSLLH
jgi:adenosylcobinamide-phosphate synthase